MPDENTPPKRGLYPKRPFTQTPGGPAVTPADAAAIVAAFSQELPRCPNLDGSSLRIVPAYTEAGEFCEARCVTVTDGERTAVYVAASPAQPAAGGPTSASTRSTQV